MQKWFWVGLAAAFGCVLVITWVLIRNAYIGIPGNVAASRWAQAPPSPLEEPVTLRLATFNVHDLWIIAKHRAPRMRAIAEMFNEVDPDIVGFQEVFVAADRAVLIDALTQKTRLKYHQYYPSGNLGSGLLISSAYPIEEAFFCRYRAHGGVYKLWEGDGLAGKGVGLARIALPGGALIDLFDTHAQAGYGNPAYRDVRCKQFYDAADFVDKARVGTIPAFFVGDMNCRPDSQDYQTAIEKIGLTRTMNIDSHIDHIFAVHTPHYHFETIESKQLAKEITDKGKTFSLSDHNGYFSVVKVAPTESLAATP